MDLALTRAPPTFWTMSAKRVVVVTTFKAFGAANEALDGAPETAGFDEPAPEQEARAKATRATSAVRPLLMRLSLTERRTRVLRGLSTLCVKRPKSWPGSAGTARRARAGATRSDS